MAKSKVTKPEGPSKSALLNYLYGLRCDTNWSLAAAMEDDRGDEFCNVLRSELLVIDSLVNLVKEKHDA